MFENISLVISSVVGFTVTYLALEVARAGLNIEIIERGGIVSSTSIKVNNNNFNALNDVTVQFGE